MKKNKVDIYELTARNEYIGSFEGYIIGQDNLLNRSNAIVNKNNRFFKIELETDTIIKNLVTLTVYNWRLADVMDSFAFLINLHMWNNIRYANDNNKFSALHHHFI